MCYNYRWRQIITINWMNFIIFIIIFGNCSNSNFLEIFVHDKFIRINVLTKIIPNILISIEKHLGMISGENSPRSRTSNTIWWWKSAIVKNPEIWENWFLTIQLYSLKKRIKHKNLSKGFNFWMSGLIIYSGCTFLGSFWYIGHPSTNECFHFDDKKIAFFFVPFFQHNN